MNAKKVFLISGVGITCITAVVAAGTVVYTIVKEVSNVVQAFIKLGGDIVPSLVYDILES